jgi:putative DNA primase/helicase
VTATTIARALGGRKSGRGFVLRCICHDDKSPSLSIADGDDGRLLVRCHAGCDSRDILAEFRHRGFLDDGRDEMRRPRAIVPIRAARPQPVANDSWRPTWLKAGELYGSPGATYLINRLGALPDGLADLRYHPHCPRDGDRMPAMVALMRDAVTNQPIGVHRTFLKADGSSKAEVAPNKMMLGRAGGSVVKLTADSEVTLGLGICEGLEDGIAVLNAGWRPVWVGLSAGGIASFPPLHGIEALTVFADADSAGRKAAYAAVANWRKAGKEAVVAEPPAGAKDFAEIANA